MAAAIGVEYVAGIVSFIFRSISRVSFVSILDLIFRAFPVALWDFILFYFMFCVVMIEN